MFNNNVVNVLSQIQTITDSLFIRYPVTTAINDARDVMVSVNIADLDSDEFPNICLYKNLGSFLGILKLFGDDRQVSFSGNMINVANADGDQTSSIIMQNPEILDLYNVDNTQIERTQECPSIAEFEMTVADFKKLKSAMSILKNLDEVTVKTCDGGVEFILATGNKYQASSDNFTIKKECDVSKEFEIKLDASRLSLIPMSDYKFAVKYNSNKDSYRLLMTSETLDSFVIMMALKI